MVDINLIPREYIERKKGVKGFFSKTTFIVLGLFILSLLFYGGLSLYVKTLNRNLEAINQEILLLEQKRDLSTEKSMIDLNERINLLKGLFKNHFYWSKFLDKVEELTIPEAQFMDVTFNIDSDKINFEISGRTTTYTNLARQIASFQDELLVAKVRVGDITLDEKEGLKFSLSIDFSKKTILEEFGNND